MICLGVQTDSSPFVIRNSITHASFVALLDISVGQRLIHYVTIDLEGFEYSILRELLPGGVLDEQGVTFCQINVKFHNSKLDDNEIIKNFIEQFNAPNSNYFSIHYSLILEKDHKVTFVNVKNENCQEAFDVIRYSR